MRHFHGHGDDGEEKPKRRGSYPPDIARRRRELGLPVTAAEHAEYARGLYPEPRVTDEQRARTREAVQLAEPMREETERHDRLEDDFDDCATVREPGEDG